MEKERHMIISHTKANLRSRHYVPPALGNGSLSFLIDPEGAMKQHNYCGMTPVIVCAGCRYEDQAAKLIRFGYFEQELDDCGPLADYTQTLDTERALCETDCRYASGAEVRTRVFCHAERNIIAIRKIFPGENPPIFHFRYTFPVMGNLSLVPENGDTFHYSTGTKCGFVRISAPGLLLRRCSASILEFSGRVKSADILITFHEELRNGDSWDALFDSHCRNWAEYWAESHISIPDKALMQAYTVAQYHLKISSTPWSLPAGLFPEHWEGRFFAYDEFYTHGALLTSGHFRMAEKIDRFRYNILPSAIRRVCSLAVCPKENLAARYPWESREDGSEGAPPGFWMDRYIHIANAAFSAWEMWLFTGDRELLRNVLYPVIRACAEYLRRSAVYYDSVSGPYIGKCTDMERLGELVERPYSTTCGIIGALEAASRSAEQLSCDAGLGREWKRLAENLKKKALPEENDCYVPYPGCKQHSIAMYHGIFPYGVVDPADPKQERAIAGTEAHCGEFAGQYFQGTMLSAWYAGVIATAEVRRGNCSKALALLSAAAEHATGCFYECFEVYERQKLPWFSTASGAIIRALNELLIHAAEKRISLWDGEHWSFILPRRKGTLLQYDSETGFQQKRECDENHME